MLGNINVEYRMSLGISIGPPKVELGEWAVQGWRRGPPAASGLVQGPITNRAARIRHGQGHQSARAHPTGPVRAVKSRPQVIKEPGRYLDHTRSGCSPRKHDLISGRGTRS